MGNTIIDNFIISLLAKPFVVLTGNSGTGKTRLALRVAEQLESANYKVKTWLTIAIDYRGRILNKTEEDIRDLCIESNVFIVKIDSKEYEVQVEMNIQISCADNDFWKHLNNREATDIKLGAAVRLPLEKRHVLIPVGADWTDTRYLLGYVNPFGSEGKTVYEVTPMVKLLLKALHPDNRYLPHFIVLDEMNLSHVERYFSTFLSAMEASRSTSYEGGISLLNKTHLAIIVETLRASKAVEPKILESAEALMEKNVPLTLPPNVFIIGTVNVDETTYMFSPKVLDRAHIIELETIHPSKYFSGAFWEETYTFNKDTVLNNFRLSIEYRESEHLEINVLSKLKSMWFDDKSFEEAKRDMEALLSGLYIILRTVNFDFGFRIFKETVEYLYFALIYNQSNSNWISYMDNVLLQKVLPKLHGNRRQLSDILEILIKFLNNETFEDSVANIKVKELSGDYITSTNNDVAKNNLDLPRSLAKLNKMRSSLNNVGYVSFIS